MALIMTIQLYYKPLFLSQNNFVRKFLLQKINKFLVSISPFWRRNDGDEGRLQINFYWSGAEVDWVITWRGQRRYQRIFHKKKFRRSQSFENEILKIFSSFQIFMEVSCFWCLPYLPITSLTDHSSEYEVFCNFHSNEYFIQS